MTGSIRQYAQLFLFGVVLTLTVVVTWATLAGAGVSSASAVAPEQYQYERKAVVCHNGRTLVIGEAALEAHVRHGDTPGPCPTGRGSGKT